MSKRRVTGSMWLPKEQTGQGADFVMPNGDKGYFYCGVAGWVLYVNGECLFESYGINDICEWLRMLGAVPATKAVTS